MLTYDLEARGGLSLYEYLYRRIRDDILSGALAAGERLPSKRALAEHLRVSVITVEGAYSWRRRAGWRPGPGGAFSPPGWTASRRRRSPLPLRRRSLPGPGGWT